MVPSSKGPMSLYLIEIPFESQLSVLKNICEETSESETWRETIEGHSPAGTVIFLQGNYMRVRRGG